MHELNLLLLDMGLIFLFAVGVVLLCHRLKIPALIGFLMTGMLIGPSGLGLIQDIHIVEMLAEIGVVLLLFTIGIEFSLGQLWQIRRPVFLGGSVQLLGTILLGTAVLWGLGLDSHLALFGGFLLSLSSTAIVLKMLQDRAEMDAPQGRVSLAILIFQDVAAIPLLLLTPVLAGVQANSDSGLGTAVLKIILMLGVMGLAIRFVIPWVLRQVVRSRVRELFMITIVGICLGVAWLSAWLGLSLALGAFIAGLIISESEYSHQAMGYIIPFRDVFTSLFFVATGMLLELKTLLNYPLVIGGLLLGTLVLKALVAGGASLLLGYSPRISALVGLMLCQVGEFSMVVGKLGHQVHLLSDSAYQIFLALSILSMLLTPLFFYFGQKLAPHLPGPTKERIKAPTSELKPRLLIIGYGVGGRNLARAAEHSAIPYRILEMNWETVRKERENGVNIQYGDATQEEILQHLGLPHAETLALLISDAAATRRIVTLVKYLSPHVWLVVRTRYVHEIDALYNLGADRVIAEEFESSIEIFSQVLEHNLVPRDQIGLLEQELRQTHYGLLREGSVSSEWVHRIQEQLPDFHISALRVPAEAELVGKTLAQTQLRQRFETTVLAIQRQGDCLTNPDPSQSIQAEDILMVMGLPKAVYALECALRKDGPKGS